MYSNKARFISRYPFLMIFLILFKQTLLSIFKIRKKNYVWFYDLSNLILSNIVKKKLLNKISDNRKDNKQDIVLSGPFKDLIINYEIFNPAQIVGMYENEVHNIIRIILNKKYNTLVNIGISNGYYFLGLLKFGNFINGIGIDIDTEHFKTIVNLKKINSINLKTTFLKNFHKIKENNFDETKNNLFFIDVEGVELEFIDKYKINWLSNSDIFVETHSKEIFLSIKKHFEKTHKITEVINKSNINYDLPNKLKDQDSFNSVDKLIISGSLRKDRTPWLFIEKI